MNKKYFLIITALFFLSCNNKNNTWKTESETDSIIRKWKTELEFYTYPNTLRIYIDSINSNWYIFKPLYSKTIDSIEYSHFIIEPKDDYFNFNIYDYLIFIKDNKIFRFNTKNYKKPIFVFDLNQQVNHKVITPTIFSTYGKDTIILKKKYYSKQFQDSIYKFKIISQIILDLNGSRRPTCSKIEFSKKIGLISFNIIDGSGEKKYKLYCGIIHLEYDRKVPVELVPYEK